MERTKKSVINIFAGLLANAVTVLTSFLTRTILIKTLGIEAVAINSLFHEVIAAISLAEMGIGSAIVFNLYKPIASGDQKKICQLMNLYKKAYLVVFSVTLVIGAALTPWIQYLVRDLKYEIGFIRIVYLLFVIHCSSSYLFSYKAALLEADQKNYLTIIISSAIKIAGTAVLVLLLIFSKNYIAYLIFNICISLFSNIIISWKVNQKYPFIKKNLWLPKEEEKRIFRDVKNIFFKQLAGKIVYSTDNILISTFVSTILVGFYSNYNIIFNVFKQLADRLMAGMTASMGNLFACENAEKCESILNKLTYFFYLFASVAVVGSYASIQTFITMWIGEEYILAKSIVFICCLNMFAYICYKPLSTVMHLSGFFKQGRNISIVSAILNLVISVLLAIRFGLAGIFIGTLSVYIFEIPIKIFYVYKLFFRMPLKKYMLSWVKMILSVVLAMLVSDSFLSSIHMSHLFLEFIFKGAISVLVVSFWNLFLFRKTDEQSYLFHTCREILKNICRKE